MVSLRCERASGRNGFRTERRNFCPQLLPLICGDEPTSSLRRRVAWSAARPRAAESRRSRGRSSENFISADKNFIYKDTATPARNGSGVPGHLEPEEPGRDEHCKVCSLVPTTTPAPACAAGTQELENCCGKAAGDLECLARLSSSVWRSCRAAKPGRAAGVQRCSAPEVVSAAGTTAGALAFANESQELAQNRQHCPAGSQIIGEHSVSCCFGEQGAEQ